MSGNTSSVDFYGFATASAPGHVQLMKKVTALNDQSEPGIFTTEISVALGLREYVYAEPRNDPGTVVYYRNLDGEDSIVDEPTVTAIMQSIEALKKFVGAQADCGISLEISPELPENGGLGKLEADVAAAMMATSVVWDAGLSRQELAKLAEPYAPNVEIAFMGGALMQSDEQLQFSPILARREIWLVIIPASSPYQPADIYDTFHELERYADELDADTINNEPRFDFNLEYLDDMVRALVQGSSEEVALMLHNSLQPTVAALMPEVSDLLDVGMAEGALAGMVAGTGPSIVFVAYDAERAEQLASRLESRTDVAAIAVKIPDQGAQIH